LGLPVVLADGRRRRTRLQPHPWRGAFSFGERLIEGAVVCPELLLRRSGEGRLVVVNQHHETHVVCSFYRNDGRASRISTGPGDGSPAAHRSSTAFTCRMAIPPPVISMRRETKTMKATTKSIAYWTTTGMVVFALFSGGIAELAHRPETINGMRLLG